MRIDITRLYLLDFYEDKTIYHNWQPRYEKSVKMKMLDIVECKEKPPKR